MIENDDWSTVEVSQGEVEYEIEEPEVKQEAQEEIKEDAELYTIQEEAAKTLQEQQQQTISQ